MGRKAGRNSDGGRDQTGPKSHSKTWSHEAWTQILAVLGDLSRKISFIFSLVLHLPRVPLLSLPALLLVWLIETLCTASLCPIFFFFFLTFSKIFYFIFKLILTRELSFF